MEPVPDVRRLIVKAAAAFAVLLALFAAWGAYDSVHGRYWMVKANGSIHCEWCGPAALVTLLWMAAFAFLTSPAPRRLGWLLPVNGRWAEYLVLAVLALWALAILAWLLLMPIA
jgi:hypothetical protein